MNQRRGDAADQIEDEEADVPHRVLDVVAEDPQEQHVAAEVQPAAVQEHRGDQGQLGGHDRELRRQRALARHHRRNGAQGIDDSIPRRAETELPKEGENASADQRHRNEGETDPS